MLRMDYFVEIPNCELIFNEQSETAHLYLANSHGNGKFIKVFTWQLRRFEDDGVHTLLGVALSDYHTKLLIKACRYQPCDCNYKVVGVYKSQDFITFRARRVREWLEKHTQ